MPRGNKLVPRTTPTPWVSDAVVVYILLCFVTLISVFLFFFFCFSCQNCIFLTKLQLSHRVSPRCCGALCFDLITTPLITMFRSLKTPVWAVFGASICQNCIFLGKVQLSHQDAVGPCGLICFWCLWPPCLAAKKNMFGCFWCQNWPKLFCFKANCSYLTKMPWGHVIWSVSDALDHHAWLPKKTCLGVFGAKNGQNNIFLRKLQLSHQDDVARWGLVIWFVSGAFGHFPATDKLILMFYRNWLRTVQQLMRKCWKG